MNHRTIDALMAGLAPVVRDYVAEGLAGIAARLKAIEEREPLKGEKGEAGVDGKDGPPGRDGTDGRDADPELVRQIVAEIVAGLPAAKDGRDGVDGKEGSPGRDGVDGKDGLPGKDGKDGVDGRDGLPGVPGRDGADGKDGASGQDGLGFDDLSVEHDGERGFTLRFARGDKVKEFTFSLPVVIDRGVWRDGAFKRGDGVTWGGSFFIAQRDTDQKPETPDCGWRLAVKRGRDGRDGKEGAPGPKGERGEPGPRGYSG